jgi:hypothetical protein
MSKAEDQPTSAAVPTQTTTQDGLSVLARRLREYAEHEPLVDRRGAMMSAADTIDGLAQIAADIDTATADDVLEAVRNLVGGR